MTLAHAIPPPAGPGSSREWLPHDLLHCKQFVLGPRGGDLPEPMAQWPRISIGDNWEVRTHPMLSYTTVCDGNASLTLLGFMLDPLDPYASDDDILRGLLPMLSSPADIIERTGRFGGRWVLIAHVGAEAVLFHDAMGLRQVFYSEMGGTGQVWAVSQPKLAATVLGLSIDEAAARYMDSQTFRSAKEYRWPVTASPYKEVRHLPPNHFLNLRTGLCKRYWPAQGLPKRSLDEGVDQIAPLLRGLMLAAANRFDITISLSAGLDSRLVLAACRDIADRISYVSLRKSKDSDDGIDIVVPAHLLNKLGLRHEVIKAPVTATAEFAALFKRNVHLAHDHYAADAEAIRTHYKRAKTVVTGSGGEIGRCHHGSRIPGLPRITPEYLVRAEIGKSEFAARFYKAWLEDASKPRDIHLLDLFEWENGSCWLGMTQLEFDVAWQEILTPFNCRDILTLMLSIPDKYREGPSYRLFYELIERLWPEVLAEPINPGEFEWIGYLEQKLKSWLKRTIRRVQHVGRLAW